MTTLRIIERVTGRTLERHDIPDLAEAKAIGASLVIWYADYHARSTFWQIERPTTTEETTI